MDRETVLKAIEQLLNSAEIAKSIYSECEESYCPISDFSTICQVVTAVRNINDRLILNATQPHRKTVVENMVLKQ